MAKDVRELLQAAFVAQTRGNFKDADSLCKGVLASFPGNPDALLLRGIIASRTGDLGSAVAHLTQVLQAVPGSGAAHHWLSATLLRQGDLIRAAEEAETAARLLPSDPEVFFNLGHCFRAVGRKQDAAACFERSVELDPKNPALVYAYAGALEAAGRPWEALQAMKAATRLAPEAKGLASLSMLYLTSGNAEQAIQSAKEALNVDDREVGAHLVLSQAYQERGQAAEAEAHAAAAEEIDPAAVSAFELTKASRLQFLGRLEGAHASFERVLSANPAKGSAYFGWVSTGAKADRKSTLARLEAALDLPAMPASEASMLHFAHGRVLEDDGQFERAMKHYDEANRLGLESRPGFEFDLGGLRANIDRVTALYNKNFIGSHEGEGSSSDLPCFVVGMLRSGTTLAEQILSCHSKIGGAGEHGFWTRIEPQLFDSTSKSLDLRGLPEMCRNYCAMLEDIVPDRSLVIDKNPANFFALGLIRIAFPKARIIHMRRNPADTCLSIYSTPTQNPPEFAFSKQHIADAYREYLRLMEHWRNVLSPELFLEVGYEDLVTHRDQTVRKMLEFCNVDFEEACLHPEANSRRVETPSFWQVRMPIHRESVGRWKRFEPWLGEFADLL